MSSLSQAQPNLTSFPLPLFKEKSPGWNQHIPADHYQIFSAAGDLPFCRLQEHDDRGHSASHASLSGF